MRILLVITFVTLSFSAFTQTVEQIVAEGDQLERKLNEEEAYSKFKEVVKIQPDNIYALNKCSELASRIGKRQNTPAKQNDFYNAARIYAERALKVDSNSAEANYVMAVALGRISLTKNGKEKVAYVKEIKDYADKAIQIDPNHFKAYHVLGKWNYEVATLSTIEKAAAKILYGGLPKGSLEVAIKYYEKSMSLNPYFVLNYLELAKAYDKDDQPGKAIDLVKSMLKLPNKTEDDPMIKAEGKKLLEQWN